MGWMPGCPQDVGVFHGPLNPQAIVLHRTYGGWPGDYSVGKQGIFHFLIGKQDGRWVQFAPTSVVQYHCNGANFRAVGIEIEGTNDDQLTPWQMARLGDVLRWLRDEHDIPLDYLDPASVEQASVSVNRSGFAGVISHVSVKTDDGSWQHTDEIEPATFARAVGQSSIQGDDDVTKEELESVLGATDGVWQKQQRKLLEDTLAGWMNDTRKYVKLWIEESEARIVKHNDEAIAKALGK